MNKLTTLTAFLSLTTLSSFTMAQSPAMRTLTCKESTDEKMMQFGDEFYKNQFSINYEEKPSADGKIYGLYGVLSENLQSKLNLAISVSPKYGVNEFAQKQTSVISSFKQDVTPTEVDYTEIYAFTESKRYDPYPYVYTLGTAHGQLTLNFSAYQETSLSSYSATHAKAQLLLETAVPKSEIKVVPLQFDCIDMQTQRESYISGKLVRNAEYSKRNKEAYQKRTHGGF